jgi:hypothetical protein
MPLQTDQLNTLVGAPPKEAWATILATAWETCTPSLSTVSPSSEVTRRDRDLADLDMFLAAGGWDLWKEFETAVEQTATALQIWWAEQTAGRAVLILDGLSLREVPWILHAAKARGYRVINARPSGSELPGETNAFARALGFPQRSALANNAAAHSTTSHLPGAHTECLDVPWEDCARLITPEPRWVLWHHWPDVRLHDMADPGKGLELLVTEAAGQLRSDSFWTLVERLTNGRRLVITSDHGYAASGLFPDVADDHAKYLRSLFSGGRFAPASDDVPNGPWTPPLDLLLQSRHGRYRYALGRRKWRNPSGYPTLAHGGLTVLEVLSPFIELSRGA